MVTRAVTVIPLPDRYTRTHMHTHIHNNRGNGISDVFFSRYSSIIVLVFQIVVTTRDLDKIQGSNR